MTVEAVCSSGGRRRGRSRLGMLCVVELRVRLLLLISDAVNRGVVVSVVVCVGVVKVGVAVGVVGEK